MKTLKGLIILLLISFSFDSSAQQKSRFIVKLEGFGKKHNLRLTLGEYYMQQNKTGDILYNNEIEITEPLEGRVVKKNGHFSSFWIEPGATEVTIYKKGYPSSTEVPGSESHRLYTTIRYGKDNEEVKALLLKNIDKPVALTTFNKAYRLRDFAIEDLTGIYSAIHPDNRALVPEVRAFINNYGKSEIVEGSKIVDFTATDKDGKSFSTQDYRGKYLILDFSATSCTGCWYAYPHMIEEIKEHENLAVLTFNQDYNIDLWTSIAKRNEISPTWPILWKGNNKEEIFQLYNVNILPKFFLISPEGTILDIWYNPARGRLKSAISKHIK